VISPWRISFDASLSDNGMRKNPIAALKKKQSNFNRHRFSKARASVGPQDRSAAQKNRSKKGDTRDTRLLPKPAKLAQSDDKSPAFAAPTKEGRLLATIFATEFRLSPERLQRQSRGGRGRQPDAVAESVVSISSLGNFIPNGALPCCFPKKRASQRRRKAELAHSRELVANHR